MKKKFLEIFGLGHTGIPAGAQSETSEGVLVGSTSGLLQRVDTGEFEEAQDGVVYRSDNQHGNRYGEIRRVYHGAKAQAEFVSTPGITRLMGYAGTFNNDNFYNGFAGDATSYIHAHDSVVDQVTFSVQGWTIQSGWVDYAV